MYKVMQRTQQQSIWQPLNLYSLWHTKINAEMTAQCERTHTHTHTRDLQYLLIFAPNCFVCLTCILFYFFQCRMQTDASSTKKEQFSYKNYIKDEIFIWICTHKILSCIIIKHRVLTSQTFGSIITSMQPLVSAYCNIVVAATWTLKKIFYLMLKYCQNLTWGLILKCE